MQLCSRKLRKISLDNSHWRHRTFEDSPYLETFARKLQLKLSIDDATFDDDWLASESPTLLGHDRNSGGRGTNAKPISPHPTRGDPDAIKKWRSKAIANWDPSFPLEPVLWYDEYIQRYAPATTSWLQQPRLRGGGFDDVMDVRGLALYSPPFDPDNVLAVSPLDDGSVCLWDVKGRRGRRKGSIVGKSEAGILHIAGPGVAGRSRKMDAGVTECISVDSQRKRAFVAVQSHLMEVDLERLQVVSDQSFEWSIAALSAASPGVPLTVGTSLGLHLFDYRARIDSSASGLLHTLDSDPLPQYSPLSQPHPQSILHLPNAGDDQSISNDIYVCGRFTSILHYDRRKVGHFSPIVGTIYTGSRLSSLASLPYSFSPLDSEIRRNGEFSPEQARSSKTKAGRTLIAGGEYNSKGSLEIYGLPDAGPAPSTGRNNNGRSQGEHNSSTKNRYNAAESKILSVATHGTRIVFSDGSGYVKWFERDGTTEVRRHRIGHGESVQRPSTFSSMPAIDDLARKIIPTGTPCPTGYERVNDNEVLFWTGEKLGLIGFSGEPGFQADEFDETEEKSEEQASAEKAEQEYGERMRLALERQAEDVRFVRNLGLGYL